MAYDDFVTWRQLVLCPQWLRGRFGAAWQQAHGDADNAVVSAADLAVKCGFVAVCPVDALAHHGYARGMPRYPADTDDTYRARLLDAWNLYEFAGTKAGLVAALGAFLPSATFEIIANRDWNGPPDGDETNWSRFWVKIHGSGWVADGAWDSPGTWDDGGVWDSTATWNDVQTVRRIVRKWKAAHEICVQFLVFFAGSDVWEDVTPWDSGLWDDTTVTYWAGR